MNLFQGIVEDLDISGALMLCSINCKGYIFSTLLINQQESFLKIGKEVNIIFKETEVALAKGDTTSISLSNQFSCKVISVEKAKILSEIKLDFQGLNLTSVITTRSCEGLNLQAGDIVTALVKSNEIMLMSND